MGLRYSLSPRAAVRRAFGAIALTLVLAACATTAGVAGPIAWKDTDMKTAGSSGANWHRFVLLLTETTGSEIEFWAIEKDVWYPSQTASVSTESGFWRLSASWGATNQIGAQRSCYSVSCPPAISPMWNIVLVGRTGEGKDIRLPIRIRLPADLR
jgi:hypothetical protein